MKEIHWNIPMKLVSCPNKGEHWATRYKRNKIQKRAVWVFFYNEKPEISFPCLITLMRNGPKELDYDNLVASFKHIRDEIADQIIPGLAPGRADSSQNILWNYDQKKSQLYSIDIYIDPYHNLTLDNNKIIK